MLDHGEAKAVIVDPEFSGTMAKALALRQATTPLLLVMRCKTSCTAPPAQALGMAQTTKPSLARAMRAFAWELPADEWDAIALNYTSGTTGNPKGVVYHHRGAATNAISNVLEWDMPKHSGVPVDLAHVPLQRLVLPLDGGGPRGRERVPAPGGGQGHLRCHPRPRRHPLLRRAHRASACWSTPRPR